MYRIFIASDNSSLWMLLTPDRISVGEINTQCDTEQHLLCKILQSNIEENENFLQEYVPAVPHRQQEASCDHLHGVMTVTVMSRHCV